MKLKDNLEAAKEKAAKQDFEVTITETLQMTVTVRAKDRDDAERIAEKNWKNTDYILDADSFVGVEFEAKIPEREHLRTGKGKGDTVL